MPARPLSPSAALRGLALCALAFGPAAAAQSVPGWASPSPPPSSAAAVAATPGTPGGGVGPGGGATNQVPVDGGLGLLALAGGAYAVRRLRRR